MKELSNKIKRVEIPEINYWIDSLIEREDGMEVKGWVYQKDSKEIPQVHIKGETGNRRIARPDVKNHFELETPSDLLGFNIRYDLKDKKNATLEITDEQGEVHEISLKPVSFNPAWIDYFIGLKNDYGYRGALEFVRRHKQRDWIYYDNWYLTNVAPVKEAEITQGPRISICMPVYNIRPQLLREAIESVINQTYPNWELCIADDHSDKPWIKKMLNSYASKDDRIKVAFRKENGHIAEATNTAMSLSTGDYIAFMDNDDTLNPNALEEYVKVIGENPEGDVFYCDEDSINEEGFHYNPFLKSDWNPRLLFSHNFITHFVVVKRELAEKIGGLRSKTNGAQDHDFLIRAKALTDNFVHIPQILYNWRLTEGSVAQDPEAKNYAYPAGLAAIQDFLDQGKIPGEVEIGVNPGTYKVKRTDNPLISVIIPANKDNKLTSLATLNEVVNSTYPNMEILAVNIDPNEAQGIYPDSDFSKVKVINSNPETIYGEIESGAKKAQGDYLLVVKPGVVPVNSDWIEQLVNETVFEDSGLITPMYLDHNNDHIISAGYYYDQKARDIYYPGKGKEKNSLGYFFRTCLPQNVEANYNQVYLIPKEDFFKLDLKENYHEPLAGIELAEKIRNLGKRVVMTPDAKVYWHGRALSEPQDRPDKDTEIYFDIFPYENYQFLNNFPETARYTNEMIKRNARKADQNYKGLIKDTNV